MRVLIRVDASASIGTGHVGRCLNLASALRAGGATVTFASPRLPQATERELRDAGMALANLQTGDYPAARRAEDPLSPAAQEEDADATLAAVGAQTFDWAIVDHYGLGAEWEGRMRACSSRIAAIDDLANRRHDCDLLLDQNLRDDGGAAYDRLLPAGCERLLGPRYALLDEAFLLARSRLHEQPRDGVLISFGGSDPQSMTLPVLRALLAHCGTDLRIDVVAGPLSADVDAIRRFIEGARNVRLHHATNRMPELMGRARLFIGAGGGTSWERCCLSVPGAVISVADNQVALCRALDRAGCHVYLGHVSEVTPEGIAQAAGALLASPGWRQRLAERSSELVDGKGAHRVAARLAAGELRLREASAQDEERVLGWRNHPDIRRFSGTGGEISASDHARWFARVLADPDCHLLIGEDAHGVSGVLRYDVRLTVADVSIYLVPARLGSGAGSALLAAGERWLAAHRPEVTAVAADVHAGNHASVRLFTGAGFRASRMRYVKPLAAGELR